METPINGAVIVSHFPLISISAGFQLWENLYIIPHPIREIKACTWVGRTAAGTTAFLWLVWTLASTALPQRAVSQVCGSSDRHRLVTQRDDLEFPVVVGVRLCSAPGPYELNIFYHILRDSRYFSTEQIVCVLLMYI